MAKATKLMGTTHTAKLLNPAPDNSVQASRARKGKDKVAAQRAPEQGLGLIIVKHLRDANNNVRHDLVELAGKDRGTQTQALAEIEAAKKQEQAEVKAEYLTKDKDGKAMPLHPTAKVQQDRRIASISATYSRIIGIVKAMIAGFKVQEMLQAPNLNIMYALSVQAPDKRPEAKTELDKGGFSSWGAKVKRVVVPKADGTVSTDSLARLEAHFNAVLAELTKYSQQTSIPVKEILAITAKGRNVRHLKAA